MDDTLNWAKRIVDRFGGPAAMSRKTPWKETTIQYWITSGSIPSKHWQQIIDIGAELGIEIVPFDFVVHLKMRPLRNAA